MQRFFIRKKKERDLGILESIIRFNFHNWARRSLGWVELHNSLSLSLYTKRHSWSLPSFSLTCSYILASYVLRRLLIHNRQQADYLKIETQAYQSTFICDGGDWWVRLEIKLMESSQNLENPRLFFYLFIFVSFIFCNFCVLFLLGLRLNFVLASTFWLLWLTLLTKA